MKASGLKSCKQTNKLRDSKKDMDEETTPEGFFLNNDSDTIDVFEMDDDLLMLRAHVREDFITNSPENQVYLESDWMAAKKLLETANKTMAEATPTLEWR